MHAFFLVACVMVIQAQTKCFYFLAFETQKIGVSSVCLVIALIKSKNTDILTDANTHIQAHMQHTNTKLMMTQRASWQKDV